MRLKLNLLCILLFIWLEPYNSEYFIMDQNYQFLMLEELTGNTENQFDSLNPVEITCGCLHEKVK